MGIVMCFAAFGKLSDDVQCGYGAERLSSESQNWWLGSLEYVVSGYRGWA